jgi:hypothetical protein
VNSTKGELDGRCAEFHGGLEPWVYPYDSAVIWVCDQALLGRRKGGAVTLEMRCVVQRVRIPSDQSDSRAGR